jgi:hypothetical protein
MFDRLRDRGRRSPTVHIVRPRHCLAGLAAAAAAALLSGCATSTPAPAPALPAAALVREHAGARSMYRQMSRALRRVRSVSIQTQVRFHNAPTTDITAEVQIPGRVEATIVSGDFVVNERYIGDHVYLRYNHGALFDLTGDEYVADTEANRWIELSDSAVPVAAAVRNMASHTLLQECVVLGPTGRLTVSHPSMTDGLPSVSLEDHGGRPGTARRRIVLSANAPYLPLRIIQRRPARPGGHALADCNRHNHAALSTMRRFIAIARAFDHRHHITLRSDNQTIDDYDNPLDLTRPPHPLIPNPDAANTANRVSV